jgi:hypothetical protein
MFWQAKELLFRGQENRRALNPNMHLCFMRTIILNFILVNSSIISLLRELIILNIISTEIFYPYFKRSVPNCSESLSMQSGHLFSRHRNLPRVEINTCVLSTRLFTVSWSVQSLCMSLGSLRYNRKQILNSGKYFVSKSSSIPIPKTDISVSEVGNLGVRRT